jgi:RES domain-containing protein
MPNCTSAGRTRGVAIDRTRACTPEGSANEFVHGRAQTQGGHTYRPRHYIHPALTAGGPKSGVRPVGALYFADAEDTAWAEWYRALAELAIPPDRQMPRDLWRWEIEVTDVADLSDDDRLAAVGLSPPQPAQRTWPAFQEIGERLWRDGYRGVLAQSAARPRHRVLCLFRDADEVPGAVAVRPPLTYRQAPAPPTGMST